MTLQDWITIIISLAAVVLVWRTVEATKDATKQQAYLTITQLLSLDKERRADRDVLCSQDPDDWETWKKEDKNAARRYCAALNVAAVFHYRNMLPHGLLLDQYYVVFAHAWHHAGPWLTSEQQGNPQLYEDFAKLTLEANKKCEQNNVDIAKLAAENTQAEKAKP